MSVNSVNSVNDKSEKGGRWEGGEWKVEGGKKLEGSHLHKWISPVEELEADNELLHVRGLCWLHCNPDDSCRLKHHGGERVAVRGGREGG